jgi:hypothetical protein
MNIDSLNEDKERFEMLSSTRRMFRIICRDSATLLDQPDMSMTGNTSADIESKDSFLIRIDDNDHSKMKDTKNIKKDKEYTAYPSHPASLSPLMASRHTCLKILHMLSSVLGTNGCAILWRDTLADIRTDKSSNSFVRDGGGTSEGMVFQAIRIGIVLLLHISLFCDQIYISMYTSVEKSAYIDIYLYFYTHVYVHLCIETIIMIIR